MDSTRSEEGLPLVNDFDAEVSVEKVTDDVYRSERIMLNNVVKEFVNLMEEKKVPQEDYRIVVEADIRDSGVHMKYTTPEVDGFDLVDLEELRERIQSYHDEDFDIGKLCIYENPESDDTGENGLQICYFFSADDLKKDFWRKYQEMPEFTKYSDFIENETGEMQLPDKIGLNYGSSRHIK